MASKKIDRSNANDIDHWANAGKQAENAYSDSGAETSLATLFFCLLMAAELVIGQANEGIPAVIIRGYRYPRSRHAKATELVRPRDEDLFI